MSHNWFELNFLALREGNWAANFLARMGKSGKNVSYHNLTELLHQIKDIIHTEKLGLPNIRRYFFVCFFYLFVVLGLFRCSWYSICLFGFVCFFGFMFFHFLVWPQGGLFLCNL